MAYIEATIALDIGGDVFAEDIEVRCDFTFGRDAEDIRDAGPVEVRCITDDLKVIWKPAPRETPLYFAASRAINAASPDCFQEAFSAQVASERAAFSRDRYAA